MVAVEMEIPELGFRHRDRRDRADRMRDRQPVHRLEDRAAAIHPRLWAGLRPDRTQGDRHGAGRPRAALGELGEDDVGAPAQDEEFVLYHADNIQATGFLEHIKLPHYVDFQAELELIRKLRARCAAECA
jgi:hypothetical protein